MEQDTLKTRIRERLSQIGKTPRGASIDAGLHADTIRNILRERSKKPRADSLQKLARALDCTIEWLLDGAVSELPPPSPDGAMPSTLTPRSTMARDVPVLGTAAGSLRGAFQVDMSPIDYVRRPPGICEARDVYALYIVGDSMSPRFEEGELVYVSERRPPRIGDYVVVQTMDGGDDVVESYCKRLCRRDDHVLLLEQLNPSCEITLPMERVRAIHRVLTLNELFGA